MSTRTMRSWCAGRDQQATGAGDPYAPPAAARGSQGLRLRVPAQRGEQPVHAVHTLGGMAAGGGYETIAKLKCLPSAPASGGFLLPCAVWRNLAGLVSSRSVYGGHAGYGFGFGIQGLPPFGQVFRRPGPVAGLWNSSGVRPAATRMQGCSFHLPCKHRTVCVIVRSSRPPVLQVPLTSPRP